MSALRFGFNGRDEKFAALADSLGADMLTWGDSPAQFPDPFIGLARAAGATKHALLGTGVLCPQIRHPAVLANQIAQIQTISDGRHLPIIGTGDLGLRQIGMEPMRTEPFIEYSTAVRDLANGRSIQWEGNTIAADFPRDRPVRLLYGADGPRLTRAAGRHADGVLLAQVGSADVVRTSLERLHAGAAEAGRSPDEVEAWFMLRVLPTEDDDGAVNVDGLDEYVTRALRFLWRTAASPTKDGLAEAIVKRRGYLIDEEMAARLWDYNERYDEAHAFNSKKNVELMDSYGLREFAGRYFFISGRAGLIKERVQQLIDAGARNFITPFIVGDRERYLRETIAILNELR